MNRFITIYRLPKAVFAVLGIMLSAVFTIIIYFKHTRAKTTLQDVKRWVLGDPFAEKIVATASAATILAFLGVRSIAGLIIVVPCLAILSRFARSTSSISAEKETKLYKRYVSVFSIQPAASAIGLVFLISIFAMPSHSDNILGGTWRNRDPWSKDELRFVSGKIYISHRVPSNPDENADSFGTYVVLDKDKHSVRFTMRIGDSPTSLPIRITDDKNEFIVLGGSTRFYRE